MVVTWIGTKENLADGFSKMLQRPALANLRDKLNLGKFLTLWGNVVIYDSAGVATSAQAMF